MSSQHGSQIHRSWAFRSIEAPYSFWIMRIHVHSLRTIAPARGDGDGRTHSLVFKFLCTGGTFSYTPDGGITDDTLHRRAIAIAQVGGNQLSHSFSQRHGLLFQTLTNAALTSIDSGTDTDFGIRGSFLTLHSECKMIVYCFPSSSSGCKVTYSF